MRETEGKFFRWRVWLVFCGKWLGERAVFWTWQEASLSWVETSGGWSGNRTLEPRSQSWCLKPHYQTRLPKQGSLPAVEEAEQQRRAAGQAQCLQPRGVSDRGKSDGGCLFQGSQRRRFRSTVLGYGQELFQECSGMEAMLEQKVRKWRWWGRQLEKFCREEQSSGPVAWLVLLACWFLCSAELH